MEDICWIFFDATTFGPTIFTKIVWIGSWWFGFLVFPCEKGLGYFLWYPDLHPYPPQPSPKPPLYTISIHYTPENQRDNGTSPFLIGDTSSFMVDFPLSCQFFGRVYSCCLINFGKSPTVLLVPIFFEKKRSNVGDVWGIRCGYPLWGSRWSRASLSMWAWLRSVRSVPNACVPGSCCWKMGRGEKNDLRLQRVWYWGELRS